MASVYVIDSTFKRTQVKVTPGRYLREVLEEACKSRKINPEEYALKTAANKIVDLSQPFRLSGLTGGAKLQLVQASRSPSVVSVALQTLEEEGGGRLTDKFPSNTSLWAVLRRFEEGVAGGSQKKLNITQQGVPSSSTGAGRLLYRQPCLNAMGRTLETFGELQKTLAQLGFSNGSVLMRLSYKDTDRPLEEAMTEISQYFEASTEPVVVPAQKKEDTTSITSMPELAPVTQVDEAMPDAEPAVLAAAAASASAELAEPEQSVSAVREEQAATSASTSNGIAVYLPPSSNTPAAALHEEHESTFEPNVDDARAFQATLTKAGRNTRLLSDKELEEQAQEKQAKLAAVQQVDVRVRYPDQSMIESTFHASETAADLYSKVRTTLRHPTQPFELRYADNKGHQALPDEGSKRLIRDIGFRGKVLVTMLWSAKASPEARQEPPLLDTFRAEAQELKVNIQQHNNEATSSSAVTKTQKPTDNAAGSASSNAKGDLEAKMKKFLGFGKKK